MNDLLAILVELATHHAPALLVSLLLLVCSAAFSGCETSLFSLSAPELNRVRAGTGRFDRLIVLLHANLQPLLPCLLFFNMAVNVAIYSIATGIGSSLGARFGAGAAFSYSLASLLLVVFFGEVFPKQLAISSSLLVARITSLPVWVVFKILRRPLRLLTGLVTALERVFDTARADHQGVREEELRLLVELSRADGAISEGEYHLIDGIVDLPSVRVKDIMIPRIDVAWLTPGSSLADAVVEARRCRHCKLPVLDADDDFLGWVDVRDVYADISPPDGGGAGTVKLYTRKFRFFSEHDRADQVLERIKGGHGDLFAVVDERGVVVGFFTLQDIMDEVLGHFGEHGAAPPPEIRESPHGYVISGGLGVREWRDVFNVSSAVPGSSTVGGLIVSLLGRIPRVGDKVELDNMEMTVLSIRHHRVHEVGLRLAGNVDGEKAEKRISARLYRN